MSTTQDFNIRIIGERINPGFKSTKALFDNQDIAGIQTLAVKQAEAGAAYLNVNIGARALTEPQWMATVIRAIQDVVTVPLSFDFPSRKVQEICLQSYDAAKAGGQIPIVNSITEHRWDLMDLYGRFRFKVILMASERVEDGVAKANKTAEEIYATARRCALRLRKDYGMPADDIFIERFTTPPEPRPYPLLDVDGTETPEAIILILRGKRSEIPYHGGDTVLETARRAGLPAPFSCEAGNCATCMAFVQKGAVTMRVNNALTPDEVEEGWVLTCQALPTSSSLTIEYEPL